ncbi:unnamed protein product [Urochloa humidicola]
MLANPARIAPLLCFPSSPPPLPFFCHRREADLHANEPANHAGCPSLFLDFLSGSPSPDAVFPSVISFSIATGRRVHDLLARRFLSSLAHPAPPASLVRSRSRRELGELVRQGGGRADPSLTFCAFYFAGGGPAGCVGSSAAVQPAGRAALARVPRLRGRDHGDQASAVVGSVRDRVSRVGASTQIAKGVWLGGRIQAAARDAQVRDVAGSEPLDSSMAHDTRRCQARLALVVDSNPCREVAGCSHLICPARRHGGADGHRQMLLPGLLSVTASDSHTAVNLHCHGVFSEVETSGFVLEPAKRYYVFRQRVSEDLEFWILWSSTIFLL